jgi:hypothetical protein
VRRALGHLVFSAGLVVAPAAACGNDDDSIDAEASAAEPGSDTESPTVTTQPVAESAQVRVASSPEWEAEGERLIEAKRQTELLTAGLYGQPAANAGAWAFRSEPLDVLAPGNYELRFAVPPGFAPVAIAFNTPPDTGFVSASTATRSLRMGFWWSTWLSLRRVSPSIPASRSGSRSRLLVERDHRPRLELARRFRAGPTPTGIP